MRGSHHIAGDEIRERLGLHEERLGNNVVGLRGLWIFVDVVVCIRYYQNETFSAEALGHDHRRCFRAVGLAGVEGGAVIETADQDVIGTSFIVKREVYVIFPVGSCCCYAAAIGNLIADCQRCPRLYTFGDCDVLYLKIRTSQQREQNRLVITRAVVVGSGCMFINA